MPLEQISQMQDKLKSHFFKAVRVGNVVIATDLYTYTDDKFTREKIKKVFRQVKKYAINNLVNVNNSDIQTYNSGNTDVTELVVDTIRKFPEQQMILITTPLHLTEHFYQPILSEIDLNKSKLDVEYDFVTREFINSDTGESIGIEMYYNVYVNNKKVNKEKMKELVSNIANKLIKYDEVKGCWCGPECNYVKLVRRPVVYRNSTVMKYIMTDLLKEEEVKKYNNNTSGEYVIAPIRWLLVYFINLNTLWELLGR